MTKPSQNDPIDTAFNRWLLEKRPGSATDIPLHSLWKASNEAFRAGIVHSQSTSHSPLECFLIGFFCGSFAAAAITFTLKAL